MSEKTHAEIIEEMNCGPIPEHRHDREILRLYAYELDAAHKREVDALRQRCTELNAEVAAKDEVIKRLDDAIAEEQRRKLATTENSSAVGNAAKCPATPMTLDEAIAHCDECSDSTPCGRQHKQLGDWLRQLRGLREHSNAAKLREAVKAVEADRLEAAYKRERAKIEADALTVGGIVGASHKRERGDVAKLREALIDVVKRLEAYVGCDHHTFHPTATTCDGITSVGKCGKIATCAAIFKARAALAAPPRNCDRFASAEEAWDAYDEWVESYRAKGETPPFNEFGWLFAITTEKEGDSDGNE